MKFNRLDRKIVIQNFTTAKNAYGEDVRTYATYHTCYAELQRIGSTGGSENEQQGRETATKRLNFFIRFFDGITEDMRVVYDGRNYDIVSIHEVGRGEGLVINTENRW